MAVRPVPVAAQQLPLKSNSVAQAASRTVAAETIAATAAFENFAKWAEQFSRSSASVVEGERLAWKRREAMLNLIQTNPAQALALAAPFTWRQQLPPQVTQFFEQQVDGRGDFKVAVGTDFAAGNTTVYRNVQLGGTNYQAFAYGRRLSQPCITGIPLHGIALEGKMAVSVAPLRRLTVDEATALAKQRGRPLDQICSVSGLSVTSRNQPVYAESGGGILCCCGTDHYDLVSQQWELAESGGAAVGGESPPVGGVGGPVNEAWTHGTKTVLYMRVNFPDDLTEPITEAGAYSAMDGVNAFYNAVSYDLAALDTTVTPVVTLPQTKACYSADPTLLLADARATMKLAGYDTANYDRDIVAFTTVPGYTFGGLAYVGGKGVWLQSMGSGVTAHELGHNYGLWHANFWDATTNYSMVGPGTNLEYGNFYDTMGAANAGIYQFNAVHKNKLDWLKADAVQVVSTNGVYRIYPFDVPASSRVAGRTYAAAVQKDSLRYYWLEFRRLFTSNPWTQNGLLLDWSPWLDSNGGTQLIDTTPGSPDAGDPSSRDDAALVIGRTFNDNAAGVHITSLQRGASGTDPWIECQVNLGNFPGNQPPVISLQVDNTNVDVGALVHFYVTASDPDGDTLAYAWSFDDLTFSTNNLPWTSKAFSTPGDHVVRCVVSDMKGGEASANAVVTVGGSGGFRMTGRVTDTNGVPLEGVLVGNGAIDPTIFIGGWTDSNG
ncbi:MAG TPA: PKD domain-containing protein, partial [Verrucomicrobiae bacterium]|nr:PKD domain-containing protein [Verrucomicrobiae bacterium]